MKFLLFTLLFVQSIVVFSQSTGNELPEVIIEANHSELKNASLISLNSKRIDRKLASDLGQLVAVFPGIQVRNYGDIGGLKTVQFRSLGAAHTAIVYDQLGLSNALSGQIDLGNLPATFIQNIDLVYAGGTSLAIPVAAKMSASTLLVSSKQNFYDTVKCAHQSVSLLGGSYSLIEPSLLIKDNRKKLGFTFSMRGRTYKGNYPFTYINGSHTIHEKRQNAQLRDYSLIFTNDYQLSKKNFIQLYVLNSFSDKGLPGSIVFYSSANEQFLKSNTFITALRHQFKGTKRWSAFNQINYQNETLNYVDSSYLNSLGYLHNQFHARTLSAETQWKTKRLFGGVSKVFDDEFLVGSSLISEQLSGNSLESSPVRLNLQHLIAYNLNEFGKWNFQVMAQQIGVNRTVSKVHFFPSLDWEYKFKNAFLIGVNARKTQRLPSFSELYYQQIGNSELKAEKADLISLRLAKSLKLKNVFSQTLFQGFYTQVKDKIIAVPTKNLFIWSIQNIAKTESFGCEVSETIRFKLKNSILQLNGSYTYNYSIDISDKNSDLYGGLLSYSPLNAYSLELSYEVKNWNISFSNTYQGWRYSSAENTYSNLLEGFHLFHVTTGYAFDYKKSQFKLGVAVNNILNENYQFIRFFPMVGRTVQVKLIWNRTNSN
ncbi:MAG: TonB-dependent receptor [Fluviicola sp.]